MGAVDASGGRESDEGQANAREFVVHQSIIFVGLSVFDDLNVTGVS